MDAQHTIGANSQRAFVSLSFVMRYFRFVDFLAYTHTHHCIYYSFQFNPDFMDSFFCSGHILSGVIMLLSRAHAIVNVPLWGASEEGKK